MDDFHNLFKIFLAHGIYDVVISPGSRNAPLIKAFVEHENFNLHSIADERSAGFFALGRSLHSKRATILCCTSGSALLNYAPAVAEAFYQGVSLIILSADRPEDLIDQGEGQTIRQLGVYGGMIKWEAEIRVQELSRRSMNERLINEAVLHSEAGKPGPVHLNVPLDEPLYGIAKVEERQPQIIAQTDYQTKVGPSSLERLSHVWKTSERPMLVIGQSDEAWLGLENLKQQHPGLVIMTESLSNTEEIGTVAYLDRVFMPEMELVAPDLVIYLGGHVISKKIKAYLRALPDLKVWRVHREDYLQDTFGALTEDLRLADSEFIRILTSFEPKANSDFSASWHHLNEKTLELHQEFINRVTYSDLWVFNQILSTPMQDSVLHFANSTAVRYAQLFERPPGVRYYANRGTSGIDGCSSTAVGFASRSEKNNLLITGDIAFLYDLNALWNEAFPPNLKIVLINNGGGGIFRFIHGPEKVPQYQRFMETHHKISAEHLAKAFGLNYFKSENQEEWQSHWDLFQACDGATILEIVTPRAENAEILRDYFNFLKK